MNFNWYFFLNEIWRKDSIKWLNCPKGFINFEDLKSIQIGVHEKCYGTSYNGHNLVINGEEYGLIRMAKTIEYDEPLNKYCNQLFTKLVWVCLDSPPDIIRFPGKII